MIPLLNGMGWIPDFPDHRDLVISSENVHQRQTQLGQRSVKEDLARVGVTADSSPPSSVDLRKLCPPVENQGTLGSCTAHAGIGCLEFFERRAYGCHVDASRLFLYKVTRNLLGWTGDVGAPLRATMAALTLAGCPPEKFWPYDTAKFDEEPSAFLYSLAQNYSAISYFRLDPPNVTTEVLLLRIKQLLHHKFPVMFGFSVYQSVSQAASNRGVIPYPTAKESRIGGHAVMAVGYDDKLKVKNTLTGGMETSGALLIRNSWGTEWGESGYGWLPYKFVLEGLAIDFWSLIKSEWVDTGQFGL